MTRVFEGRIGVEYGQASMYAGGAGEADLGDLFEGQLNGMLGAAEPGYVHIMTATHTGEVPFIVEVLDSEPPIQDDYEDIAEVSLVPEDPEVNIVCMMGWGDAASFELPEPSYRVRMSARNTDASRDAEAMGEEDHVPFDEYLLQVWPAPVSADAILKQTSSWADYTNATWGTAPSEMYEKPVYGPDPWDDWNAANRHQALRYFVELAGAAVGIDSDPAFVQLLADADLVFADFVEHPQAYRPTRNEFGWFDSQWTPVQQAAFDRYQDSREDPFAHMLSLMAGRQPDAAVPVEPEVTDEESTTDVGSEPQEETEYEVHGAVEMTVQFGTLTSWSQIVSNTDSPRNEIPDIDWRTATEDDIAAYQDAMHQYHLREREDPQWRKAQAWRAATELLTYYGFEANRDQRGASFIQIWSEDAMGRRLTPAEEARFYELLGIDPPQFDFPIPPGV